MTQSIHTEIVVVTYRRAKQGEREPVLSIYDYAINRPDPDTWPEDLPCYDWQGELIPTAHMHDERFGGVHLDLPTDWFGLRFEFTGQFFDGQQNALWYECDAAGQDEVFEKWADELKAIGDKLLDDEIERRRTDFYYRNANEPTPREVTFLTAWNYTCSADYEGEVDSDWELIGLIDLSRIKELIVSTKAEGAAA